MNAAVRVLGCMLLLAAVSGCSGSAWVMPDGVITSASDRGKLVVGGIYASTTPSDSSCCWVQRRSQFRVAPTPASTDLVIEIYLPDIALFRAHPQGMDVTLNGTYRFRKCCYAPGDHSALITLPPALRAGSQPIDVSLEMRESFVPAAVNRESGDQRSLAAILVGVDFRSL